MYIWQSMKSEQLTAASIPYVTSKTITLYNTENLPIVKSFDRGQPARLVQADQGRS